MKTNLLILKICTACYSRSNIDIHHIKTRGSGGTDDSYNLMPLCRFHHIEVDQIGLVKFSRKYPNVSSFLYKNGWEIETMFGKEKWQHNKGEDDGK